MRDRTVHSSSIAPENPSRSGPTSTHFPPLHSHHHQQQQPYQQHNLNQHPGSAASSTASSPPPPSGEGPTPARRSLGSSPTSAGEEAPGAGSSATSTTSTAASLPESFPADAPPRGVGSREMERVKARASGGSSSSKHNPQRHHSSPTSSSSSSSSDTTTTTITTTPLAGAPYDSPDPPSSASPSPGAKPQCHPLNHPHHNLCEKREKSAGSQTKSKTKRKRAPPLPVLHPDVASSQCSARGCTVTVVGGGGGCGGGGGGGGGWDEDDDDDDVADADCGEEAGGPGGAGSGRENRNVFRFSEDSRPMFSPIPTNASSDTDGDLDSPRSVPSSRSTKPEKTVFPAIHVEKCERAQPSYAASCSPEPTACLSPDSDVECDNEVMTTSLGSGGLNVPAPYLHRKSDGRIVLVTQDSNRGLLTSWSRSEGNLPDAIRRSHSSPGSQSQLLDIKYRPDWYPRPTLRQSSEVALHELRRRDGQRSPASPRRLANRLEPLDLNQRAASAEKLQSP